MAPLRIDSSITLSADDLFARAVRSSGPGGQNVNKVSTKVELHFRLGTSSSIGDALRERIRNLFHKRIDRDGDLVVFSQKTRDQIRNLEDAREKMAQFILQAAELPKPRVASKLSRGAKRRRVADKRIDGQKKQERRVGSWD